ESRGGIHPMQDLVALCKLLQIDEVLDDQVALLFPPLGDLRLVLKHRDQPLTRLLGLTSLHEVIAQDEITEGSGRPRAELLDFLVRLCEPVLIVESGSKPDAGHSLAHCSFPTCRQLSARQLLGLTGPGPVEKQLRLQDARVELMALDGECPRFPGETLGESKISRRELAKAEQPQEAQRIENA